MPSIIHFQPLSGVVESSPYCYLLDIDGFCILLDCGWDEHFSTAIADELAKISSRVDCILLSSPDIYHLGALPYLYGRLGLTCPTYATRPVCTMGQMFLYDLYQSHQDYEDFTIFNLDDIDAAFDEKKCMNQVKYNQTIVLKGKGEGLKLTALCAGHMIGGCLWKITKDEEEIVYAVDFAHKKERHLNAISLESLHRPHVLIFDIMNAAYNPPKRRERDEELMTTILQTLRGEGDVLVAIDTAGRVLELAYMLDQLWQNKESGLNNYGVCILNNVAYNAVEFAKLQIEWMSDKLVRGFEEQRQNPFAFQHIQLCHSLGELKKVKSPKVVVTSQPDLESGFSRHLFVDYCRNPKNTVILTYRTTNGTLARYLIDNPQVKRLTLDMKRRVPLEGLELKEHIDKKREEQMAKSVLDQESKEDAELKASDVDADIGLPVIDQKNALLSDLYIRPYGRIPYNLLKRGPKPNAMYRLEKDTVAKDEFGVSVDAESMRNKLKEINKGVEIEPSKTKDTRMGPKNDEEMADGSEEIPTKTIVTSITVDIKCPVKFIDFEGRADAESLEKILSFINPKKLIFVHGTLALANMMGESATRTWGIKGENIFYPQLGQIVECSSETHIYRAKLSDAFLRDVQWKPVKGAQMALVNCKVWYKEPVADREETSSEFDIQIPIVNDPTVPTLEPAPPKKFQLPPTTLVANNYKLSDIKKFLLGAGVYCDFLGGSLVCNGNIVITKAHSGKLTVQGPFSVDYYKIRKILYKEFCVF